MASLISMVISFETFLGTSISRKQLSSLELSAEFVQAREMHSNAMLEHYLDFFCDRN
jgi:hypothetical protein